MEYVIEIFCSLIIFGYFFYKWANKNFEFFSKRNVAHEKPVFLIGNNLPVLEGKESSPELLIRLHNQFKNEKIYGYYGFRTPNFIIRDPKLFEQFILYNFESFMNRAENKAVLSDETTSSMVSALNDTKWLEMQLLLTHVFLENEISKVFNIVTECNKAAIKFLKETTKSEGKEIDLEDFFHRYSNDVVASAGFGIEINSYKDKDNEFSNMASNLLRSRSLCAAIKSFYLTISPQVYKIYRVNRLYIKTLKFFRSLFSRTFGPRRKDKMVRQDSTEQKKETEFLNIIKGLAKKFSTTIKSVVLIIFPQVSILVQLGFFVLNIRSYVKNLFNPRSRKRDEEKTIKNDDTSPKDRQNNFLRIGSAILRNITGGFKSLIFTFFPQILLIHRLYIYSKTLIKYMKGKTVQQDDPQKKKKLSKIDAGLLKLERFIVVVKLLILTHFPAVSRIIKLKAFNAKALDYMKGIASQTVKQRQNDKIIRLDMVHLILEAWKNEDAIFANESKDQNQSKFSENDIIAQCIMFIFSGLGPITNMLCATFYELMKNPEVQEKLYEEVLKMNEELNGADISYELLTDMKYLNMVVCESLRKWPPVPLRDRVCTKPYTLKDADGKIVQDFKPGDNICFSVYGSHYDEDNFKNPFTFDPDRFSDENLLKKKPYTYFPFGYGARACRGKKFGLMVAKIMLYHLILEFKITSCSKSTADLFASTRRIQLKQSEFYWMKLLPRNIEPKSELTLSEEILLQ